MEKRTVYVRQLYDLYLENRVSMATLAKIVSPLGGLPMSAKELISKRILELAEHASGEQELLKLVEEEKDKGLYDLES